MDSEPRWLDIQDELYPQITIPKQIIFQNGLDGNLTQYYTQIKYNSFKRQIDITPVIYKYFIQNNASLESQVEKNSTFEIMIKDKLLEKLDFVGIFPHDDMFVLGEQFLSDDMLYLIVKVQDKEQNVKKNPAIHISEKITVQVQSNKQDEQEKPDHNQYDQDEKEEEEISQMPSGSKAKPTKRKTIGQILKLVAQWRKLIMMKKHSSTEAAEKIGMSKRSLEDYFTIVKLAQKYGFDFQNKMKNPFAELRNFVKDNHETKPAPKIQILQKFKNNKK